MILPSADSKPNIEAVGRSALILNLLGVRPPYTRLLGRLHENTAFSELEPLNFVAPSGWKLLAADMAYLCVDMDRLAVIPIKGERMNFLWDLSRHLFRSTDLTHTFGAHRTDAHKRQRLIDLFHSLRSVGVEDLYTAARSTQPIDEIIVLRRQTGTAASVGLRTLDKAEVRGMIEEGMLLSSDRHGSPFWKRPHKEMRAAVRHVLGQIPTTRLPTTRELVITSNLNDGDCPAFLYDSAVRVIKAGSLSALREIGESQLGNILLGIDRYNEILFRLLSTVAKLKMVVTLGEKVFQDGAFWRYLVNRETAFELEVQMLSPTSGDVKRLEKESYSDKPAGFLRQEIEANLEVIQAVSRYLMSKRSPVTVRGWLYPKRTAVRTTFAGEDRAIFALYSRGLRTGSDTVFVDVQGPQVGTLLEGLRADYEALKRAAKPFTPLS